MSPKRPRATFESTDTDHEYDGGESHVGSSPATSRTGREVRDGEEEYRRHRRHDYSRSDIQLPPIGVAMAASVAERNAALLLMNLSVTDGSGGLGARDDNGKAEENKLSGGVACATVKMGSRGFETCVDERPAKRTRRTISI